MRNLQRNLNGWESSTLTILHKDASDDETISSLLRRYGREVELDENNKYNCTFCSCTDIKLKKQFSRLPKVLVLNVLLKKNKVTKTHDSTDPDGQWFEERIQLPQNNFGVSAQITYRLTGIITYEGKWNYTTGQIADNECEDDHYIAYCKSLNDDRWMDCNDIETKWMDEMNNPRGIPYIFFYEQETKEVNMKRRDWLISYKRV